MMSELPTNIMLATWQSWWIWQYWINQKSYTMEDAAFITGNYIKIQSKIFDHDVEIP